VNTEVHNVMWMLVVFQ